MTLQRTDKQRHGRAGDPTRPNNQINEKLKPQQ